MSRRTMRQAIIEKGIEQLREEAGALPTANQLIREALEAFTDSDSPIDLREWVKTARAYLESEPCQTRSI